MALINATDTPVTRAGIADELRDIGVQSGDLILMHTALSKLGWVSRGFNGAVRLFDMPFGVDLARNWLADNNPQ